MRKDGLQLPSRDQPALIVTYGNTTRKHRPLDRDILLLGRASACDIGLVSPEVAPVHCAIVRTAEGWRIRDCSGGRLATRINGRAIHEEELRDADVLQIGTFSFEVHLPASSAVQLPDDTTVAEAKAPPALVQRLQRSRRRLAQLALKMRRRALRNDRVPPTLAELERQAESLRGLQRDCESLVQEYQSRLNDLEKAEREVCDERAALERECAERRTRLEQAEHELSRRTATGAKRSAVRPAVGGSRSAVRPALSGTRSAVRKR